MITMDMVFSDKNIFKAIRRIEARNASPGLDQIRGNEIRMYWIQNRKRIMSELKSAKYVPVPLRNVLIEKPGKEEKRQILIYSVVDQMLQHCIRFELERYFIPLFHPDSYGFISGKNTGDALEKCIDYMKLGRLYVVDADIRKCFDNIQHYLIKSILKGVVDDEVLYIIIKFIKNPVLIKERLIMRKKGLPQGSCISPVLANAVLNKLDWFLNTQKIEFVRYADDMVLFCKNEDMAYESKKVLEEYLCKLKLELNLEKTNVVRATELEYLGYSFKVHNSCCVFTISKDKKEKMLSRMERCIKDNDDSLMVMLDRIGRFNRGWLEYYGRVNRNDMKSFLEYAEKLQIELILNKIKINSDKYADVTESVIMSKEYVNLSSWYEEMIKRKEARK